MLRRPVDIPTQETVTFVTGQLPEGARRILEVGAGSGHVAVALDRLGLEVTAIDASPEAVANAARIGAKVALATWPDFDGGGFDAVLFTRSLHHIHDLARAVDRAHGCLRPGGRMIVEDFDCRLVSMDRRGAHADHELHAAAQIEDAVAARFALVHASKVPYLYRYLVPPMPRSEAWADFLARVLELETALGAGQSDHLVGRRLVGEKCP